MADSEFYRIGGHVPITADVRIIAATHQDLLKRSARSQFREDLYHRLNVIRIHLPALRERVEDIPLLARNFLARIGHELGIESRFLTDEAREHRMKLKWPGNVRELENTCRWLTVMCHSREIYVRDLPAELRDAASAPALPEEAMARNDWKESLSRWLDKQYQAGDTESVKRVVEQTERVLISVALKLCHGKKHEAANLLGWGRNTLTRKVRLYGME